MNTIITGRYLAILFFIVISSITNTIILASEFDPCTDIVIDQTSKVAYGAYGAPHDGEFTCYRDKDKKIATIKRKFIKGTATGKHFCFDKKGTPKWVLVYLNGERWKMALFANRFDKPKNSNLPANYRFTACNASEWTKDWCSKADFKECLPE